MRAVSGLLLLHLVLGAAALAEDSSYEFGGHAKLRAIGQSFDSESVFHDLAGAAAVDAVAELRLAFAAKHERWSVNADYQLLGLASEFLPLGLPADDGRLLDLTDVVADGDDWALAHRLDRLWVGYTGDKTVVRLGRQALSWGNGLFFTPMDLVNPFDPTAIDTEYKAGDDMLYGQYLRDNGDDVQAAVVFRRDPLTGERVADRATAAVKYHGFAGSHEFDVLVAEDNDNTVFGFGGTRSVGGAIWRADIVIRDAPRQTIVEVATNVSYAWQWGSRNVSGSAEYYHDGDDGHYLAGNLMVEMSPLWMLTPTIVARADEPSALLQIVNQYSLSDNMNFLGSLNLPLGAHGTEYGGPESAVPNRYLSFELSLFAQLAWYF
jgi:hypothetical protein